MAISTYARHNLATRAETNVNAPPWSSGSFKDVWKGKYTDGDRAGIPCVTKIMRGADPYLSAVFDSELAVVAKAQQVIDAFNKSQGFTVTPIYLNRPSVWGFLSPPSWEGKKCLVEPLVEPFVKYNSNSGWTQSAAACKWHQVMQALSHFSYDYSNGKYLLCDLQGGGEHQGGVVLTDPIITSATGEFGATDLGQEGIDTFFARHKCNGYCRHSWRRPANAKATIPLKCGTSMMNIKREVVPSTPRAAALPAPAAPATSARNPQLNAAKLPPAGMPMPQPPPQPTGIKRELMAPPPPTFAAGAAQAARARGSSAGASPSKPRPAGNGDDVFMMPPPRAPARGGPACGGPKPAQSGATSIGSCAGAAHGRKRGLEAPAVESKRVKKEPPLVIDLR